MSLVIEQLCIREIYVGVDEEDGALKLFIEYAPRIPADGRSYARTLCYMHQDYTDSILSGILEVCEISSVKEVNETPIRFAFVERFEGEEQNCAAIGHDIQDRWCHLGSDGKVLSLEELMNAEGVTRVSYEQDAPAVTDCYLG